jgi:hypothetical protein
LISPGQLFCLSFLHSRTAKLISTYIENGNDDDDIIALINSNSAISLVYNIVKDKTLGLKEFAV